MRFIVTSGNHSTDSDASEIILDVGCGNGWLASKMLTKGKSVISMDISEINAVK